MNGVLRQKKVKNVLFLTAAMVCSVAFLFFLSAFWIFPDSVDADTFGHLFKINFLHHSLKEGTLYPIYTEYWYNGMELFRYWPAFSYYVVAILQFFTGGDIVWAFYLFMGLVYFLNMSGWFLIGKKEECPGLAFVMGNLFFFCPDNIRIFMGEGNIPRILITSLLPFVFYFVWEILHYNNRRKIVGLGIVIWIITATHFMIAAMTGISVFLFCAFYSLMNKKWRGIVIVTVDLILAYLAAGIFLLPGLTGGGLTSQNSESSVATISKWAQEAVKSLNPFFRYLPEHNHSFYFGVIIFCIAVFGVISINKKSGPGFITTLFIFVSTTTAASSVVRLLPMSQVFWMQRFVPMAMCLFFFSILLWKKLKKSVIMVFILGMLFESLMTASLLMESREQPLDGMAEQSVSTYLLPEAKQLTENRLGILDSSLFGSIPSWYLSKEMDDGSAPYSFGWAYQGAETLDNIVNINQAAETGFYVYAFDRLLELGDDTVLVSKRMIPEADEEKLNQAAEVVGYTLVEENDSAWLYRLEGADGTFGIVKQYTGLAIGKHAQVLCYLYPQFGYGRSNVLDEYSLEELLQYKKLYLSGFTYRDKEQAEALLTQAAENGVRIYIEVQHIPMNPLNGKAEFLGVYAQYVSFNEKFPILSTSNGSQFKLDFKSAGYEMWNTAYVSGASERVREAYYDDATRLTYVARNGNPNITFLGLNPVFYYQESQVPELLTFLNEIFEEQPEQVCESRRVPVQVSYESDKVVIQSAQDGVNTGIADLDCFVIEDGREKQVWNNLITVDEGTTTFSVRYTNFKMGAIASAIGILGSILYWSLLLRFRGETGTNETTKSKKNHDDDGMCSDVAASC